MQVRIPKLVAMLIAAFAIGAASIVFQTIIGNRIVTPCLLGMNALYTLTHTAIFFVVGMGSVLVANSNVSFGDRPCRYVGRRDVYLQLYVQENQAQHSLHIADRYGARLAFFQYSEYLDPDYGSQEYEDAAHDACREL